MLQSEILFPEKHNTIYFELLSEHFQYEQKKWNARQFVGRVFGV